MTNILSTPLLFPKIEPDNWGLWWDLWDKNVAPVTKITKSPNINAAPWQGFDVYVKSGIDVITATAYSARNLNCPEMFPTIFNNLALLPIDIDIVRVVSSTGPVGLHHDTFSNPGAENEISVRTMLYDNNRNPTFYYASNQVNDNTCQERIFQTLPEESNTWAYWDTRTQHGSVWYPGYQKLLIMYYGKTKQDHVIDCITQSANRFSNYVIYQD